MAATMTQTDVVSEFQERLRELYENVKEWIREEEPKAKFTESSVELNEQFTGRYKAKSLTVIRPGQDALTFTPKAATVIGARGWVEVRSGWGYEDLFWVYPGGALIGFEESADGGVLVSPGHRLYPGVPEGWAWDDGEKMRLRHLTRDVFLKHVLRRLSE